MKYAAKTITGIRKQNQDAVFIPERGMIAIAPLRTEWAAITRAILQARLQ